MSDGSLTSTDRVRAELVRVRIPAGCCQRAEVVGVLRFAGQLHPTAGRMVVLAPVGSLVSAVRVQRALRNVYGCSADILGPDGRPHQTAHQDNPTPIPGDSRTSGGYQVLVTTGGADLARRTGLTDRGGRVLRGLPPHIVNGGVCDAAAVWRGAFLVAGALKVNGRSSDRLVLTCPSREAAMALVGAARRLGVLARARELRGHQQVRVREADSIHRLLTTMGVRETMNIQQCPAPTRTSAHDASGVGSFQEANLRRAQSAAARACARVEDAMSVLGGRGPQHLVEAATLRLAYPDASLEELGQRYANPPMTKDAIAGRLRRLVELADRKPERTTSAGTE